MIAGGPDTGEATLVEPVGSRHKWCVNFTNLRPVRAKPVRDLIEDARGYWRGQGNRWGDFKALRERWLLARCFPIIRVDKGYQLLVEFNCHDDTHVLEAAEQLAKAAGLDLNL